MKVNKKFLLDKEIYIQDVTEDVLDYISSIVGKKFKEDMMLKTRVALFLIYLQILLPIVEKFVPNVPVA